MSETWFKDELETAELGDKRLNERFADPLGAVDAQTWAREDQDENHPKLTKAEKHKRRIALPIEEKESIRWIEGIRATQRLATSCPETLCVSLSDSEGDIYERLVEPRKRDNMHWIVRAGQDRVTLDEAGTPLGAIRDVLLERSVLFTNEMTIRAREQLISCEKSSRRTARISRRAQVEIRVGEVTIKAPAACKHPVHSVAVNVVWVREPIPHRPPRLTVMVRLIACLGGYMDRLNREDPPGVETVWKGLQRVRDGSRRGVGEERGRNVFLLQDARPRRRGLETDPRLRRDGRGDARQCTVLGRDIPHAITFARILRKLSLADLQHAFAAFLNEILHNNPIVAAVDGKVAKQMKDDNGDPILMLNVFAQNLKIHLASWSVRGDKTNEPGCLKQHLEELFTMYPSLKLLTGDAIYAQRPLLEAIQEYHRDYLVQIKDNQGNTHDQMKRVFHNAVNEPPSSESITN